MPDRERIENKRQAVKQLPNFARRITLGYRPAACMSTPAIAPQNSRKHTFAWTKKTPGRRFSTVLLYQRSPARGRDLLQVECCAAISRKRISQSHSGSMKVGFYSGMVHVSTKDAQKSGLPLRAPPRYRLGRADRRQMHPTGSRETGFLILLRCNHCGNLISHFVNDRSFKQFIHRGFARPLFPCS